MTKLTSYRETFRRHRLLLCAPMVLAVVVAAWSVLGSEKSYESTANLWVSYPASVTPAVASANPGLIPAQQEQSVLNELLATRSFALTVGQSSALAPYLATHGSSGWSPLALVSSLGGTGSLEGRIIAALGPKHVVSTVAGPQVLQISYKGPSAAATTSTLGSLVTQLRQHSARYRAGNAVQVIDPPTAAISTGGKKKELLAIVGGLFVGALISFLGTVALTPGKSDSWDGELVSLAPDFESSNGKAAEGATADGAYPVAVDRSARLSHRARVIAPSDRHHPDWSGRESRSGDDSSP